MKSGLGRQKVTVKPMSTIYLSRSSGKMSRAVSPSSDVMSASRSVDSLIPGRLKRPEDSLLVNSLKTEPSVMRGKFLVPDREALINVRGKKQ